MNRLDLWEEIFPHLELSTKSSQIANVLGRDRGIIDFALEQMDKAGLLRLFKLSTQSGFSGYAISDIYFTNKETFDIRCQLYMESQSAQSMGTQINNISGGNFVNSPFGDKNTALASNFKQESNQDISSEALSDILSLINSLRFSAESLSDDYRDEAIKVVDGVLEDFSSTEIDNKKARKSSRSLIGFILPVGLSLLASAPNAILNFSDKTVKFISDSVDLIEKIDNAGVNVREFIPDDFRKNYLKNP